MMMSSRIAALALGGMLTATLWGTNPAQAQNIAEP